MTNKSEDLRALLRGFYDDAQAATIEHDLHWADDQMARWPGAVPPPQLVEMIKSRIRADLARRRHRRVAIRMMASVAAVAVVALASYNVFRSVPGSTANPRPLAPVSAWAIDVDSDARLDEMSDELDEIMNSMIDMQLDTPSGSMEDDTIPVEGDRDVEASFDNFWKG